MLGPRSEKYEHEKYKKDVIAGLKPSQFRTHCESWGIPLFSNETLFPSHSLRLNIRHGKKIFN